MTDDRLALSAARSPYGHATLARCILPEHAPTPPPVRILPPPREAP